jgi:hypothetical protein
MGLVLAAVAGVLLWIILWSLEVKSIDAFMITVLIVVVAITVRMMAPFLPGNRS